LSDAKPKLEQFAVDARRTPELVIRAHLPDQLIQLKPPLRTSNLLSEIKGPAT